MVILAIFLAVMVVGLVLGALLYNSQVVTRRNLRPFKMALESGQCSEDERRTFQALIEGANSCRSLLWCAIILTCFTGWGILLFIVWLMKNSAWKSQWRIETSYSPIGYAQTFGPQISEALTSTSYATDVHDSEGKYQRQDSVEDELQKIIEDAKRT